MANSTEKTYTIASNSAPVMEPVGIQSPARNVSLVATQKRERLEKLNVYFSDVDLQTIFKASAARGQRPCISWRKQR